MKDYRSWGDDLDPQALQQMEVAMELPVAVRGALMPDAHVGYGLPIGGVIATRNAVIPYAVGVDIACRMKLTVLDFPVEHLDTRADTLARVIEAETRFGIGAEFRSRRDHPVMQEDWSFSRVTQAQRDRAARQLGTSGSGNHFVEFGRLELRRDDFGLKTGVYPALLSHSGSRGTGAAVASHYSAQAMALHPELPRAARQLAWLDLDSDIGREYWAAMELMGRYASAHHALIHDHILRVLGSHALASIENHHNFAWRERHGGEDLIVHRKGATPAAHGVPGIIPGSMATPGYVVRGRGHPDALESAAHGAGRAMSRTAAKTRFRWAEIKPALAERGVRLLSAGLDEVPGAYKDIEVVMAAQRELVDIIARFDPRIVRMAAEGERAED